MNQLKPIPHCGQLISALLPTEPAFCERDFALVMAEFYHRCAMYTPWEQAIEEKPKNRFEKFISLICSAGAFVPQVQVKDTEMSIVWLPYKTLPEVTQLINTCFTINNHDAFDLLISGHLNEWVRQKFIIFRNTLVKHGNDYYRELLNLFFMGFKIDVSSPARRQLLNEINRWLSVLHIDFTVNNYAITIKDISKRAKNETLTNEELIATGKFALSMSIINCNKFIPLSKIKDKETLRAPIALSNYLPEIRKLIDSDSIALSEKRLIEFIDYAADLLSRLGIKVILPKSLLKELKPGLVVKSDSINSQSGSLVSYLDLETLQDFQWQIAIGDEVLAAEEFNELVNEKKQLVSFRNGYVRINPQELSLLLKKSKEAPPTVNDFLQAHFTENSVLAFNAGEVIDNMFREHDFSVPASLNAQLRPYQKRGYNWICSLLYSGFGCMLADDMGLGKTVQSIAVILHLKEEGLLKTDCCQSSCLVIAPAGLINNWEKELARFAPSLHVTRYHGKGRRIGKNGDVLLTTYQTVVRDLGYLQNEAFCMLLVDEAHLMKNPNTRISRAVKQLRSEYRLALSGTPVENRLEDLRSLFDFIMPGYLGDAAKFKEQYRVPIEVNRNKERAVQLQKITSPFLLRRLKTDKAIINDLPDKIIINEYAAMGKEQAALYESVVSDSINKSQYADPKIKTAIILSLLTGLKQICAHPRVFDKTSPALMKLSGKAKLLIARLKEIVANREKTLIFSQYVETLECLEQIIIKELKEKPLLYHGALNQDTRSSIVNQFQNDPCARILLISLRAGGLGLNLTAASRVIHYDLWYNPAVEKQATDRAFRIGQKRTVFVHRFITKNSFEEKVDAMLTSKQELADMTIASGESWIAKMSYEELKALFER